jgi:hypothetical protein
MRRSSAKSSPMPPAVRPDVVELLAVAQAWVEMKFVEAGAASKDQLVTEVWIVGDFYDLVELGEVLFELVGVGPNGVGLVGNSESGDHRSGCTSVLTTTCQRGFVLPRRGPDGDRRVRSVGFRAIARMGSRLKSLPISVDACSIIHPVRWTTDAG